MPITDIITPEYLRSYLSGVEFYNRAGQLHIPDEVFSIHISGAVSQLETELSIPLRGSVGYTTTQDLDVVDWDMSRWNLHRLPIRPVNKINSITLQYSNYPSWELPVGWVFIRSREQGAIQVLPGAGNIRYLQGPWVKYAYINFNHITPAYLHINYDAGFESVLGPGSGDKDSKLLAVTPSDGKPLTHRVIPGSWVILEGKAYQVSRVINGLTLELVKPLTADFSGEVTHADYDSLMVQAAMASAAQPILEGLGTFLYGPGVTSRAIGIDGLSQSKGIRADGPFAGWIRLNQERYQKAIEVLRSKWGATNVVVM
jgi:hypothetical protein